MQRVSGEITGWQTDRRAVARRNIVKIIRHDEAAGAGHVFRHYIRLAGNMSPDVPLHDAHVNIVTGARPVTDEEAERLAFVEILDGLRTRRFDRRKACDARKKHVNPATHAVPPMTLLCRHPRPNSRPQPHLFLIVVACYFTEF
jgi:hypothetical protein